jgi:hypothetical protein
MHRDFDRSAALRFIGIGLLAGMLPIFHDNATLQFSVGALLIAAGYAVRFFRD